VQSAKELLKVRGILLRKTVTRRYFSSHPVRKLQLGAHRNSLPGWLNTDLYPQTWDSITLDATCDFPFPDASFDYIFSEHQLEHISYADGHAMLSECYRVLKPGGKLRIAVPSLQNLLDLFVPPEEWTAVQQRYVAGVVKECFPDTDGPGSCFVLNAAFYHWGHRFLYNFSTLQAALDQAGFAGVEQTKVGESADKVLRGLEFRTSETDRYETLVVEAVRPTAHARRSGSRRGSETEKVSR